MQGGFLKIIVTGGSGRVGTVLIPELIKSGHNVLNLDREQSPLPSVKTWITDLRQSDIFQAVHDSDAIIHLAGFHRPGDASDSVTFENNTLITYRILNAARYLGVGKVIIASSMAIYGILYSNGFIKPEYLPIDVSHPCKPVDPYGLSKLVGETMADSFARSGNMQIFSLRFPRIVFDYQTVNESIDNPQLNVHRLWLYIDYRDVINYIISALNTEKVGHTTAVLSSNDSLTRLPLLSLIRKYYPDIQIKKDHFRKCSSCVDSSTSNKLLGYEARHSWKSEIDRASVDIQSRPTF